MATVAPPSAPASPQDGDFLSPRERGRVALVLAVVCVLALGSALLFIARFEPAPPPVLAEAPPVVPAPPAPPAPTGAAAAAVAAAESAAGSSTELAVVVLDRTTGEIAVGERGREAFLAASLAKVVVAVDLLDRRRTGDLQLDARALGLIGRALGPSDDGAMNTLWSRYDGAGAAGRVGQRLGLTGIAAPESEGQWGQMVVPAEDMVRIWSYILDEMPAADRDLLLDDLDAAPDDGEDGFDQAYGLLSPDIRTAQGAVAKQGWMCCVDGQRYLHSAGTLGTDRRYVVSFLARVPRAQGWDTTRDELDEVVTAAVAALDA